MKKSVLALAASAVACDSRAKASDPSSVRSDQKSKELESCSTSSQCQDNLRCFDNTCKRTARSTVGDYYAAADVFALPTQYEAWGLVIVEAMASGLAVLTSRCAGAAVAVETGRTGLLLDDPASVAEIAEKLRCLIEGNGFSPAEISASVARFEWAQVLRGYESILAQCAA